MGTRLVQGYLGKFYQLNRAFSFETLATNTAWICLRQICIIRVDFNLNSVLRTFFQLRSKEEVESLKFERVELHFRKLYMVK